MTGDKTGQDPRQRAVALAFGEEEGTPRLLAKGYGDLAERIVDEARRQGVYVHDSPELVRLLMQVDMDEEIPPALYRVIAELLAWVGSLDKTDDP